MFFCFVASAATNARSEGKTSESNAHASTLFKDVLCYLEGEEKQKKNKDQKEKKKLNERSC